MTLPARPTRREQSLSPHLASEEQSMVAALSTVGVSIQQCAHHYKECCSGIGGKTSDKVWL